MPYREIIYISDEKGEFLIPYKADYSNRLPLMTVEAVGRAQVEGTRTPKTDKQLGVIVPLVKQRPNNADWMQLASIAMKYPRINTVAIVNPTLDKRGVGIQGSSPDEEYINGIRYLKNVGIMVLGYMTTAEGTKDMNEAKMEMDRWRNWYPDLDGIFFDELSPSPQNVEYYKELDRYADKEKGFKLTVADIAYGKPVGEAMKREDYFRDTGIDVFIVYQSPGYPAESWYGEYKKEWASKYHRSRFCFMPYQVANNDALACQNFLDKAVGIEKVCGYVYVQAGPDTDNRGLREWNYLSPLLDNTMFHMDLLARGEGVPFTKGAPLTDRKLLTQEEKMMADKEAEFTRAKSLEENPDEMPHHLMNLDEDGVRKIYPSVLDPEYPELSISEPDLGSHNAFVLKSSIKKFLNVEMTCYFKPTKIPKDAKFVTQQLARGLITYDEEKKKKKLACNYSGYICKLLQDGSFAASKMIMLGAETTTRGIAQATNTDLLNRWIGFKTMIYNYEQEDAHTGKPKTYVMIEGWVDDNVTDQNGNLVVKNDWKRIMTVRDQGGWFTKSKNFKKSNKCPSLDSNNDEKFRKPDEIINQPGGAVEDDRNSVVWAKGNGVEGEFKFVSVREIRPIPSD